RPQRAPCQRSLLLDRFHDRPVATDLLLLEARPVNANGNSSDLTSEEHLAAVHDAERTIARVVAASQRLRSRARLAIGGAGAPDPPPLREAVAARGSLRLLVGLGALSATSAFMLYALLFFSSDVSRTLGVGSSAVSGAVVLRVLALSLSGLVFAALSRRLV